MSMCECVRGCMSVSVFEYVNWVESVKVCVLRVYEYVNVDKCV